MLQAFGKVEEVSGHEGGRLDLTEKAEHDVDDLDGFRRVGARTEFVQQDQRSGGDRFEEGAEAHHLGAEAPLGLVRAVELDDRGEETVSEGQAGRRTGCVQPGLSKNLQNAQRLQEPGLAP